MHLARRTTPHRGRIRLTLAAGIAATWVGCLAGASALAHVESIDPQGPSVVAGESTVVHLDLVSPSGACLSIVDLDPTISVTATPACSPAPGAWSATLAITTSAETSALPYLITVLETPHSLLVLPSVSTFVLEVTSPPTTLPPLTLPPITLPPIIVPPATAPPTTVASTTTLFGVEDDEPDATGTTTTDPVATTTSQPPSTDPPTASTTVPPPETTTTAPPGTSTTSTSLQPVTAPDPIEPPRDESDGRAAARQATIVADGGDRSARLDAGSGAGPRLDAFATPTATSVDEAGVLAALARALRTAWFDIAASPFVVGSVIWQAVREAWLATLLPALVLVPFAWHSRRRHMSLEGMTR